MTNSTDPPVSDTSPQQEDSMLSTACQAFDWTRQMRPDLRSLVTFWLETDNRVVSHVSIVPTSAGGAR